MTDLITRLSAELDRREAIAQAAIPGPWRWGNWSTEFGTVELDRRTLEYAPSRGGFPAVVERDAECTAVLPDLEDPLEYADDGQVASAVYIAENDPATVLRLIEAHRKIVQQYAIVWEQYNGRGPLGDSRTILWVLKRLAEGYGLTTEEGT